MSIKQSQGLVTDQLPIKGSAQRGLQKRINTISNCLQKDHQVLALNLAGVRTQERIKAIFSTINDANTEYALAIKKFCEALGMSPVPASPSQTQSVSFLGLAWRSLRSRFAATANPVLDPLKPKCNEARTELLKVGSEAITTLKILMIQIQSIIDNCYNIVPDRQKESREALSSTLEELEKLTNELETAHQQDRWDTVTETLDKITDLLGSYPLSSATTIAGSPLTIPSPVTT